MMGWALIGLASATALALALVAVRAPPPMPFASAARRIVWHVVYAIGLAALVYAQATWPRTGLVLAFGASGLAAAAVGMSGAFDWRLRVAAGVGLGVMAGALADLAGALA